MDGNRFKTIATLVLAELEKSTEENGWETRELIGGEEGPNLIVAVTLEEGKIFEAYIEADEEHTAFRTTYTIVDIDGSDGVKMAGNDYPLVSNDDADAIAKNILKDVRSAIPRKEKYTFSDEEDLTTFLVEDLGFTTHAVVGNAVSWYSGTFLAKADKDLYVYSGVREKGKLLGIISGLLFPEVRTRLQDLLEVTEEYPLNSLTVVVLEDGDGRRYGFTFVRG